MGEKAQTKPTLYLDKGAIGLIDLKKAAVNCQICFSEATLFDLLNDKSEVRFAELERLNEVGALYLYLEANQIREEYCGAREVMESINPLELKIMTNTYRYFNGGGSLSLFDVMQEQISALLNADFGLSNFAPSLIDAVRTDPFLDPLKKSKPEQWRRQLQRSTKRWSQSQEFTLRSVLEENTELHRELSEFFPDKDPRPEQIQLAAMLLGILQMGSDKGILSTNDDKSKKAATNGYVDCMHIMFGLHCTSFVTTDKATARRYKLLNEFWNLGRGCFLLSKKTQHE